MLEGATWLRDFPAKLDELPWFTRVTGEEPAPEHRPAAAEPAPLGPREGESPAQPTEVEHAPQPGEPEEPEPPVDPEEVVEA